MDIIRRFARDYRKDLESSRRNHYVGGGSIMLNYQFRDATQDLDVILHTASGIKDVIVRFADENGLHRDWMNTDFVKTASFSEALTEVSRHYCWLNNQTLEIRTVSGVYLIAMKMVAHRDYRNDISDAIGILIEEAENGHAFTYDDVEAAYQKLYHKMPDEKLRNQFRDLCSKSTSELKAIYNSQIDTEALVGDQLITYIKDGADINTNNVNEITARIRTKMQQKR